MDGFTPLDLNTWPRSTHWHYYRNLVKAMIAMTNRVDVSGLLHFCHREGVPFSAMFLYAVCKTVNGLACMRMFADEQGNPCVWDVVHPNFTLFHPEDETFSDVWMEYSPDQEEFLSTYRRVVAQYQNCRGIKVRDGQPPNFFCISAVPWVGFDALTTATAGDRPPALFPIINYGKYEEQNGKMLMPVSISIAHAAMDGYHIAKFYSLLQQNLNGYR